VTDPKKRPFPRPPPPVFLTPPLTTTIDYWPMTVPPPTTACKHGEYECETCGTSDTRDALHTTRGGKGAVARLGRR
jgi:hypothetical protein